jgi:energy-coupling factor transporter ATP-binding protein EcfA2
MKPKQPRHTGRSPSLPDIEVLFGESAAGIAISGDSGSGKSNLMQILMQALIRQGVGLTLIDPHGDLAADLERYAASLPDRLRRRLIVIRYADTTRIAGINPLSIGHGKTDELTARARIASKVGHVSKILLYAWGERDFNSKPVMFKWTTRFLTMLASAGLTIADVRHFFDVNSPVYQALARTAPDVVSRLEMEELADMRPREREELIASTKNRFLGFLQNPITAMVLGMPGEAIDVMQLIRKRAIVIVNLERGGVLRDEDVEIFANLWLNELFYAAYNTPREQRVPHFLFLDELPVFQSSADLITRALAQVRKFKVRLVCAFQGTQLFAERTEDRLLNALVGQCNVQLYFRHKNPVDAKFFAEIVKLPSIDLLKPKHILKTPQQFQEGHDEVVLTDHSETWSDAEQEGSSQTDAVNDTDTRSQSLGSLGSNRTSTSQSSAHSNVRTDGRNWSSTRTQGGGLTHRTTLVPRIRTRDIVTSIQFFTADEQVIDRASDFTRMAIGSALLYIAGRGVAQVGLPLATNPFRRTPAFAAKKLSELRTLVFARSEFATPEQLLAKREQFEREMVRYLERQVSDQGAPGLLAYEPEDDNPLLNI